VVQTADERCGTTEALRRPSISGSNRPELVADELFT
jgi:hypothetical protein